MAQKILILDDDKEFNNLLTDIFEQADYDVTAALDSKQAIDAMKSVKFDLIVTDQRLPQVTGLEFIKSVRSESIQIPIIMVSGYLDNETIRELIRSGVNGIFIKPLNIFSLLKKSAELIELSKFRTGKTKEKGSSDASISSEFNFVPCHSSVGRELAEKVKEIAGFSRNLLLIGPAGMPYEELCSDIVRVGGEKDCLVCFRSGDLSKDKVLIKLKKILNENKELKRITIAVLNGDELLSEEIKIVMSCVSGKDEFDLPDVSLRMIVCLKHTVEELYDRELIDQDFYMFLGSNELRIPSLNEMMDEVAALAERELKSISADWSLDSKSKSLLQRHEWTGNILELKEIVVKAASLAKQKLPRSGHFEAALSGKVDASGQDELRELLVEEKKSFLSARSLLSGVE